MVQFHLVTGDITSLGFYVDALVNAANPVLQPGQGVCGAFYRKSGDVLFNESMHLAPVKRGTCVVTSAPGLDANYVFHAVGARFYDENAATLLSATYTAILDQARKLNVTSLAIPALGTGIYAWPVPMATAIAFATMSTWLLNTPNILEHIYFVVFDQYTFTEYDKAGSLFFDWD